MQKVTAWMNKAQLAKLAIVPGATSNEKVRFLVDFFAHVSGVHQQKKAIEKVKPTGWKRVKAWFGK